MKTILFISFLLLFSCNTKHQSKKEVLSYSTKIQKIKNFAKTNNYNNKIAFMIDYSLHSGLPRFFVVDLKNNKIIKKGLVCHGDAKGKNNTAYCKYFSNTNDSHCTSLGFALIGKRDYSNWGNHYKYWLNGLDKTNSNIKDRTVVLHAWKGVPNSSIYPKSLATSWGCPTVSVKFLERLDKILKKEKKVLLYSFK